MLEKERVEEAVDAILALVKAKDDSTSLVDLPKKIDIQTSLKHIPKLKHKTFPVLVPMSIHYEGREVCIFVKDLDQKSREYEATVQHYKNIFAQTNTTWISKIVPIKALRTDYSLPSSKISLAKAYDLFLAENCVIGLLPGLLGKIFYSKKKTIPVKVDLDARLIKRELDRVIHNPICIVQGSGSSCSVTVANDKMDKDKIVANVLAAAQQLVKKLPGGKANIRNMYMKGADTTAVPLYINIESANRVKLPVAKVDTLKTYTGNVTTVEGAKVKIRADGYIELIKHGERNTKKRKKSGDNDAKSKPLDDADAQSDGALSVDSVEKINKMKKNSKSAKTEKRTSEGKDDGIQAVEKKKRKQSEISANKKSGKSCKKGKRARKV